ncbi:hypothetical protein OQA88_3832 [Cercophora sp. LCS_1]
MTPSIPTISLSPFTTPTSSPDERLQSARSLVTALHTHGFAYITGHGLTQAETAEAFHWAKRLFDLPLSEKMKAPHPEAAMPHRGYSGIGKEKVYSRAEVDGQGGDVEGELRRVVDFKENYEVGSEHDDQQANIWLPESVLPGFRTYMAGLYARLCAVGQTVLDAIGEGLDLSPEELAEFRGLNSPHHSQLRMLHYPGFGRNKPESESFTRCPAHCDWGAFTLLFQEPNAQDPSGGLELQDPTTKTFTKAIPQEGALVLNVGDMLQRFTNGYFISALHRVSVPSPNEISEKGVPSRYSIPFFVAPVPSHTVRTLPRFITDEAPASYEPVRYQDYGAWRSEYSYQGGA